VLSRLVQREVVFDLQLVGEVEQVSSGFLQEGGASQNFGVGLGKAA